MIVRISERLVERVLVDELKPRHGQLAADDERGDPGGEEEEAVEDVGIPIFLWSTVVSQSSTQDRR